jgi:2-dehydropantoate 2-reductase
VRVLVYGAGAVGQLLGAYLLRARNEVLLVAPEPDVIALRTEGLGVEGPIAGSYPVAATDALVAGLETEAILLTVKAPALAGAGQDIARKLDPLPPILALQNGLDIELDLIAALEEGGAEVLPGTVTRGVSSIPALRLGPGRVRQTGSGEILLDVPDLPRAKASVELFRGLLAGAGLAVRTVPEIRREIWRKVILNAAINPVTADHGVPNGQLARDPWRGQAEALLAEAREVARAEGYEFSEEEIEADLWRVVHATAANRSSMLQDLDRGRPTEIEAIVGRLRLLGRRHGLATPSLDRAYARIRAREREGHGAPGPAPPQP